MHNSEQELKWGILGTGHMASRFVEALALSETGKLQSLASRDIERARSFLEQRSLSVELASTTDELLADPSVQAVYICSPHPAHLDGIVAAARAGKHILCEKPLTLNAQEAKRAMQIAEENSVLLMEGFMYRSHPQTLALLEELKVGKIGQLKSISASFSFNVLERSDNPRLLEPKLGGGAILDLGCYPLSYCRLIVGAARGEKYTDPIKIVAHSSFSKTGVDLDSIATLIFPDDITAQISCGLNLQRENCLRVYGSKGRIELATPWSPGRCGERSEMRFIPAGHVTAEPKVETTYFENQQWLLAGQIDFFAQSVQEGSIAYPGMNVQESLANMHGLDQWRQAIGLVYPQEKSELS